MLIQFNSDKNIEGTEALARQSELAVRQALTHVSDQITRIEIHVSDENSNKKGGAAANSCRIEARLSGRQPMAVSNSASSVAESVDGAAEKLKRAIESVLGRRNADDRSRMREHRGASADRGAPMPESEVTEEKSVTAIPIAHADGGTRRAETPSLEGRVPLPEEITGRASATGEDLVELFEDETGAHLADGFRGGSEDETREALDQSDVRLPVSRRADQSDADTR